MATTTNDSIRSSPDAIGRRELPPLFPAGAFGEGEVLSPERRHELIGIVEQAPALLRAAVAGLADNELDTLYRNWTIRQIVHHLADSHINCYIRFKWTLTEDHPTIKAYNETDWSALEDSRRSGIGPTLTLLEGVHARWVQLLRTMTEQQFARTFFHPESQKTVSLNSALSQYAWHGRHHTAQIEWLRKNGATRTPHDPE